MAERRRDGLLRRAIRAVAGEAADARRAAIERNSARFPDAYRRADPEREGTDEERDGA